MVFKPDPNSLITKEYQKLLYRVENKEFPIDADSWTVSDSLVYLCIKYKERFNQDFIFTYKDTPSKSFEYKSMSRVWMMTRTKSGNGRLIKDYMDWYFESYSGKRPFRSITALAKIEVIGKYTEYQKAASIINTSSKLPDNIKAYLSTYPETAYINSFGELVFMYRALSTTGRLETEPYKTVFENLFIKYSSTISKDILENITQ